MPECDRGRRNRWLGTLVAALGLLAPRAAMAQAPPPPAGPPKLARIEDFAPPEEFVMVGTVKTHFIAKGNTGPHVVLIHGFGASTYTWRGTIEALAGRYRVYALDLKGFGLTAKPKDGEYHPQAFARHVLGFLDALKIDRAVLVGHSMGGAVAVRVALERPERVSGLVLVAAAPVGWGRGDEVKRAVADQADAPERSGLSSLAQRVLPALLRATMTRERVEAGLRGSFHDPRFVTPEMVEVYHRPITIEGGGEALAAMMNPPLSALRNDLPPLESLKVPTLITRGAHDKIVPKIVADQYARAWPHARVATFERSGHIPQEEEAEAFEKLLLDFLGRSPDTEGKTNPPGDPSGHPERRP